MSLITNLLDGFITTAYDNLLKEFGEVEIVLNVTDYPDQLVVSKANDNILILNLTPGSVGRLMIRDGVLEVDVRFNGRPVTISIGLDRVMALRDRSARCAVLCAWNIQVSEEYLTHVTEVGDLGDDDTKEPLTNKDGVIDATARFRKK